MDSPVVLGDSHPPRRVSQDPRLVCRHAPSPVTPSSPMRAWARCFRIGDRLQHLRKIGRCHRFHEAESGSLALGSRLRSSRPSLVVRPAAIARPDRPVSRSQLPFYAGPELHGERAIHMADTSQSARQIRVTLAHRRNEAHEGTGSQSPRLRIRPRRRLEVHYPSSGCCRIEQESELCASVRSPRLSTTC